MRRIIRYLFIMFALLLAVFSLNSIKTSVDQNITKSEKERSAKKYVETQNLPKFMTNLPVVEINTNGQQIDKERETWAEISVYSPNNSGGPSNAYLDLQASAVIKYRGNSSYLTFDKKQYRIKFRKGYEKKKKKRYDIMGMPKATDWVLNGPFLDRTLIRNHLLYDVSRKLLPWAPDSRYCEVVLNGEYQGLYLMVEPVTNEKSRLNLVGFGMLSGRTAYVLKRERVGTEENELNTFGEIKGKTSNRLSISYPQPSRLTKTQRQWIERDINEFERVLFSEQFDDPIHGYAAYIDMDSFVNYYIINEFSINADAGYLSTYIYKDLDGKLKLTVWDFDNSFDNYQWEEKDTKKFYIADSNWFNRLFQDRKFTESVVASYRKARKGVLSDKNLLRLVDENVKYIGDTKDRNFKIWGYTFNEPIMSMDKHGKYRDPQTYEEAVQQLKKSIVKRGDFLDHNIDRLYKRALN